MEQGTKEWKEYRFDHIGASDAPVILGISPYKTPYQLWREKTERLETEGNFATERGKALEPEARKRAEEIFNVALMPMVVESKERPWQMASLDAISLDGQTLVEIKCGSRDLHEAARRGEIREDYVAQIQHQLLVCGLELGYYLSYHSEEALIVPVARNDALIKKIIAEEEKFWECMKTLRAPPLCEKDFHSKDQDEQWAFLSSEWKEIYSTIKELEEREKVVRESLISLTGGQNAIGNGIKVQKIQKEGNVDYKSIPELFGVDLSKYRKPSTNYWKFSEA